MNVASLNGAERTVSAHCLTFVFDDPLLVSGTAYKVLRSQEAGRFVPCVRSKLNGRDRLTYLTRPYLVLRDYAAGQPADAVRHLLATAVESLLVLRDNGFLSIQGAFFAEDMLFVDQDGRRLLLVYLPLARSTSGGDLETARQAYRASALVLDDLLGDDSPLLGFEGTDAYRNGDLAALFSLLGGKAVPDGCAPSYQGNPSPAEANPPTHRRPEPLQEPGCWSGSNGYSWLLAPTSSPSDRYEIPARGGVIGKSPSRADIVVSLSPAISRTHCRVIPRGEYLVVEDLGSANGTSINGKRIAKAESAQLHEGDRLRLADIQFTVQRRGGNHA